MLCKSCKKVFNRRTEYLLHITVCGKCGIQSTSFHEDNENGSESPADDSDADPWWFPEDTHSKSIGSFSDTEPHSSPVSDEQKRVSAEANKFIIDIPHLDYPGHTDPPHRPADLPAEQPELPQVMALNGSSVEKAIDSPRQWLFDNDHWRQPESQVPSYNKTTEKLKNIRIKIAEWKLKRNAAYKDGNKSKARRLSRTIKNYKDQLSALNSDEELQDITESSSTVKNTPCQQTQDTDVIGDSVTSSFDEIENVNNFFDNKPMCQKPKRKQNYCLYCNTLVYKFSEHIEKKHSDKPVGQALINVNSLNCSREKRLQKTKLTDPIRKEWNAIYNSKLLSSSNSNTGVVNELITVKRGHHSQNQSSLVACDHCQGVYRRDKLSVHLKSCSSYSPDHDSSSIYCAAIKKNSSNLIPNECNITSQFKEEILKGIRIDSIMESAINDPLIMDFGSKFHLSRREPSGKHYIIREMRDLARLLLTVKSKNSNIKNLKDCLKPTSFNEVVEAALSLAGYSAETGCVKIPSVGYRLTQPLKDAANIVKHQELTKPKSDRNQITLIDDFLSLMKDQWKVSIGRICTKEQKKSRVLRKEKMTCETDIIKMASFIEKSYNEYMEKLKTEDMKHKTYDHLTHMLVTHIMLLIRRRPVDFKHAKLIHYSNIDCHDDLIGMAQSANKEFCDEDIQKCKSFHLFYVPGKNLEIVPIVLTPKMKKIMDFLIKYRNEVGITCDTLFILSCEKPIKPNESLKLMIRKVKLNKPEHFTNNGLRHQAATFSRLHSDHPQYQDYLASALGHTLSVHKKHYDLPLGVIQKLIVCPILNKIMTGRKSTENNCTKQTSDDHLSQTSNQTHEPIEPQDRPENDTCVTPDRPKSYELEQNFFQTQNEPKKKERWSEDEQQIVLSHFGKHILDKKIPPRSEVVTFWNENKNILKNRSIAQVMLFVRNHCTRKQLGVSPKVKRFLKIV